MEEIDIEICLKKTKTKANIKINFQKVKEISL